MAFNYNRFTPMLVQLFRRFDVFGEKGGTRAHTYTCVNLVDCVCKQFANGSSTERRPLFIELDVVHYYFGRRMR